MTLVVASMFLIVGTYTYAKFGASINRGGLAAAANTTLDAVDTNTYSGLNLASITPIALAASAIMFIIIIAFAFRD